MPPTAALLLRRLRLATPDAAPDAALLDRYVRHGDESAFATLVARHGPMVLRVCRRALPDHHAAEDAFQATFLVFARRARAVRRPASLAAWLHGVAFRVATRARALGARRPRQQTLAPDLAAADPRRDPLAEVSAREALAILDGEVARLPEAYRLVVLLCCLEGLSQEEAARRLGWTAGSVKGRLERGRRLLHERLARRGLKLAAALALAELSRHTATAGAAGALVASTTRVAMAGASGVRAEVAALAEGALPGAAGAKVKVGALLVVMLGIVAAGAGALRTQAEADKQPEEPSGQAKEDEPPRTDPLGDPLPPDALTRLGTLRLRHGNSLWAVGFVGDGRALLSADWHGVHVWDTATGRPLRHFGDPRGRQFQSVAFSGDGRGVVLTRSEGEVEFWDSSGKKEWEVRVGRFPHVALSPDGKLLALEDQDSTNRLPFRVLDVATGKELHRLVENVAGTHNFIFSSDGKTVVGVKADDGPIRFWDTQTGKEIRRLDRPTEPLGVLALSPDGKTLAAVAMTKFEGKNFTGYRASDRVLVWDVAGGKVLHRLPGHKNGVYRVAFAPDGKTLLTADWEQVRAWGVASGKELPGRAVPVGGVGALAFSPDGRALLTGGADNTVRLWDLATGRQKLLVDRPCGSVLAVAVSPDGRAFATGGQDKVIRLWDAATGRERRRLRGHTGAIFSLAFFPDGKRLVSTADFEDGTRVWDVASGDELFRLPDADAALAPGGSILATFGKGGAMRVCEAATGREVRTWQGPAAGARLLGFAPDGRAAFCWAADNVVSVWDVSTGKELRHFPGHVFQEDSHRRVYCVAFSPDGRLLAFGGQEPYIALHDAATGQEMRRLDGFPHAVSALTFSPDGRILASGDWTGGVVRLWEVATGQQFGRFTGHEGRVHRLAFSADGTTLISGGEDTTALVWDVTGRRTHGARPAAAPDLEALWADLAKPDAVPAQQAVQSFAAVPEQSLPLLQQRLRPVAPVAPERLARFLARLDDDDFDVRQQATKELRELGRAADPVLRRALASRSTSEEVRRRVEALLEKLDSSAEWRRAARSLQVLEQVGTAEAERILAALAEGAPEARLTMEAKGSLQRVKRRAVAPAH
jgi:RNA polymerase sigma factor (sigma-70 family)